METRVKETIDKLTTGISLVSITLIGHENLKRDLFRVKDTIDKLATGISQVSMTLIGHENLKRDLVRVTFKNFEDKRRVVKNNAILRCQDIFIDDDLTKDERSIQAALRQRARTEREKGNDEVRVRYKKYY